MSLTARSHVTETYKQDILLNILRRLERLEDHCSLDRDAEDPKDAYHSSMSVSSDDSDISGPNDDETHTPTTRGVVDTVLSRINDQGARSFIRSNVFYHLAHVKSRFFDDERCIETINAAMTDIERMEDTHTEGQPAAGISKELAKKWIHCTSCSPLMLTKHVPANPYLFPLDYYAGYEFEGFRVPLGEDFVMTIPDLLEIPHVQLDYTSQIIYYNILLQGLMLSTDECPGRGGIVQYLYNTCMTLVDGWLDNVKHTPADLYAAILMVGRVPSPRTAGNKI